MNGRAGAYKYAQLRLFRRKLQFCQFSRSRVDLCFGIGELSKDSFVKIVLWLWKPVPARAAVRRESLKRSSRPGRAEVVGGVRGSPCPSCERLPCLLRRALYSAVNKSLCSREAAGCNPWGCGGPALEAGLVLHSGKGTWGFGHARQSRLCGSFCVSGCWWTKG